MKPRRVVVDDLMQQGYTYLLTEPTGRNYDDGFMTVELHPKADGSAELLITDGNGKTLYNQRYASHTFPLAEGIKLYAVWGETSRGPCWHLMLTSEY